MPTLGTKNVDGSFKYDPFSEYDHQPEDAQQEPFKECVTPTTEPTLVEGKEQLLKNIDDMFNGADFILDVADRFMKRLGGR